MQTRETQQAPARQPKRPTGVLVAAAAFILVVIAFGVLVLVNADRNQEVVTPTDPVPSTASPLVQVDRWENAMNEGDLEGALAVLSPQARCALPAGTETCEQHLGYLIAVGSHFERQTCQESAPYRCSYRITSQLHATMGYPDFSLPMSSEFALDENGLLVADFFGTVNTSALYMPAESGDLWAFMRNDYPEIIKGSSFGNVGFGPDPYDRAAGIAAMEAAARFNDPARITESLAGLLAINVNPGVGSCATQDGMVFCQSLIEFFGSINAVVGLDCDPADAADGVIICPITIDSDIHRALGSGPSTSQATIEYRGGKAQALLIDLRFADDTSVEEAFREFAGTVEGLHATESLGLRPLYDAVTGPIWVAAAADFASQ